MKFLDTITLAFMALSTVNALPVTEPIPELGSSSTKLNRRYFQGRPTCGLVPGNLANYWDVFEAFARLGARPEFSPSIGPGPARCITLSCYNGSGIHACNDRTSAITISSKTVAGVAEQIMLDCASSHGLTWFKGQWFNNLGWNVILSGC